MALSGGYWPAHPKPLPDELFSSWLGRTARANAPKVHSFCHLVWPGKQIWTRDIDRSAGDDILQTMIEKSATPEDLATGTLLRSYEGVLFGRLEPNKFTPWLLPIGVYHRTRRRYGLQWCPLCLGNDRVPYFRKHWRLALHSCCPRHGVLLLDRCSDCGSPAIPHRGAPSACHECGRDYAQMPSAAATSIGIQYEWRLSRQIKEGWTSLDGFEHIHPLAYFAILRQLVRVVTAGRRGSALRAALHRRWPEIEVVTFAEDRPREFEDMGVTERHYVLQLVSRLIEGWPFGLVGASIESRNWASWLLKDMKPHGYHLWEPARHYLSRSGMRAREQAEAMKF